MFSFSHSMEAAGVLPQLVGQAGQNLNEGEARALHAGSRKAF